MDLFISPLESLGSNWLAFVYLKKINEGLNWKVKQGLTERKKNLRWVNIFRIVLSCFKFFFSVRDSIRKKKVKVLLSVSM